LNRRNILQRLVSNHISKQAKVWGSSTADKALVGTSRFGPVDAADLEYWPARERPAIAGARRMIVESGNPVLDLWYEDLFEPYIQIKKKAAMLDEISDFLGLGALDHPLTAEFPAATSSKPDSAPTKTVGCSSKRRSGHLATAPQIRSYKPTETASSRTPAW
jgi:hypothetical protein